MRINLPPHEPYIGKTVPGFDGYEITEYIAGGNNALVFKAYNSSLNRDLACKIIPPRNKSENWVEEIQAPNALRHPSVVKCPYAKEWENDPNGMDSLVIFLDYVHGITLKEFINQHKNDITVEFIEGFLNLFFNLLNEMEQRSVKHGDLHTGNIMVEENPSYKIRPSPEFRVTDFSILSATSDENFKDDYLQIASILKDLLKNVNYNLSSPRDKFAFNFLNNNFLSRHLIETDKTLDPYCRRPVLLEGLLGNIDEEYEKIEGKDNIQDLETPFEFLNCEQIGSRHTILDSLYSDRFIGLSDIEDRNNLILTGPRGCGKTTIFKSLSLQHRYLTKKDDPKELRYIGIYFRCDDLYFSFPRYKIPPRSEAYDLPVHFLTATLLIEVLDSIENWGKRHFEKEFGKSEEKVSNLLWEILEIQKPNQPNSNSFRTLKNTLIKQQKRAVEKVRFSHDPNHEFGEYFGVDKLIKSCDKLISEFRFLSGIPFYFFIDDYSIPKITEELQKSLNRLLMIRSSSCFFKISTESSVSYINGDLDGKSYVEGREFILINLGLNFILSDVDQKMRFIEDVFSRRLKSAVNFPEKELDNLLGNDLSRKENQVARDYREGKKVLFWGKSILCRLCSGDIFYLIKLVGNMVTLSGGEEHLKSSTEIPRISSINQNEAFREGAGNFLKNLRDLPNGDRLVEIVTAFGQVSHSYLKFKNAKNINGNPPHQASRIEPYEELRLEGEAKSLYKELLRYSVFFEDSRGKSRRGKIVPRLYLRRFLIPHFKLTCSMRDPLELEPTEMEMLLLKPNEFESKKRLKKMVENKSDEIQQGKLFPDEN